MDRDIRRHQVRPAGTTSAEEDKRVSESELGGPSIQTTNVATGPSGIQEAGWGVSEATSAQGQAVAGFAPRFAHFPGTSAVRCDGVVVELDG